jgi:hypothetical protein
VVKRFKKLEQIFLQASSSFTEEELRKVAEFIENVGEIASRATDLDWADARDRFGSRTDDPMPLRKFRCSLRERTKRQCLRCAMSSPSLKMPSLSPTAPTQVSAAGPKRLDESLQTSDLALQKLHPGLQLQQFLACQIIDARKRLGIETHPF